MNIDNEMFMHGTDHCSNVIDENEKKGGGGGRLSILLIKIAVYLNSSFRMQTSTELMS